MECRKDSKFCFRLIDAVMAKSLLRVVYIECRFAIDIGCERPFETRGIHFEVYETLEHLCLCCTPREELHEVLQDISRHRNSYDHLIIEVFIVVIRTIPF